MIGLYAGIELGGTFIKVCVGEVSGDSVKILQKHIIETQDPLSTIDKIIEWLGDKQVTHLGIASFGPVCLDPLDSLCGYITSTPKPHWKNTNVGPRISQALGLSSYGFDTDVNACAKAEFRLGKHKVQSSLAYITIGTGVGVGLIVNGQCVHGLVHPEGGHVKVNKLEVERDFKGVCSFHGDCLEGLCTNVSIAKRLGLQVSELDQVADENEVWESVGYYIANLCLNITLITSVELILIGGGVMNRKVLYPIIRNHFKKLLNGYVSHPLLESIINTQQNQDLEQYIKEPTLGNDVGLIGALLL